MHKECKIKGGRILLISTDDTGDRKAFARGKLHKLPQGMTELDEIRYFVSRQDKWSREYKTDTYYGSSEEWKAREMWNVFRNEIVSDLLGRDMKIEA